MASQAQATSATKATRSNRTFASSHPLGITCRVHWPDCSNFKPSAVWIILQPENLLLTFHFLLSPTMPKRKTADDTADKAAEAFPPSIVEACNGTFLAFGAKIPLVPDCCLSLGCLFCHWPPASASWLCCRCCASLGRCEVFSDLKATVPVLVSSN